jgi:hypothetical protein
MDGILPILEALSCGESQALFNASVSGQHLCIASILCDPPKIGLNLPPVTPGTLASGYDKKISGRAFRDVCIGLSEKFYPKSISLALAREIASSQKAIVLSAVVKNGVSVLSGAMARAGFVRDEMPAECIFIADLYEQSKLSGAQTLRAVLEALTPELYVAYITEGSSSYLAQYFNFIENIEGSRDSALATFSSILQNEFEAPSASTIQVIISLLLSRETSLDPYRLAIMKELDPEMEPDDYLKASFKMIEKGRTYGMYNMQYIAEVYLEAGYAELAEGIRDKEDYLALSNLPGLDISQIDVKKIPKQARGLALEMSLGL